MNKEREDFLQCVKTVLGKHYRKEKVEAGLNDLLKKYRLSDIKFAFIRYYDRSDANPAKSGGGISIISYLIDDFVKERNEFRKNVSKNSFEVTEQIVKVTSGLTSDERKDLEDGE